VKDDRWRKWQVFLLIPTILAVFAVMGRSVIDPSWGKQKPLVFPQSLTLPNLALVNQSTISLTNNDDSRQPSLPGSRYIYRQDAKSQIALEMFYWLYSDGSLEKILNLYWQSPSKSRIKLSQGKIRSNAHGSYFLYHHAGRAYLASCLNAIGGSTVTSAQFSHNRNTLDLQPQRWLSILLGIEDARDWRCLFTQLSTTTSSSSLPLNEKKLEENWEYFLQHKYNYFSTFIRSTHPIK
jgi:cyanosortase A-associated protein